MSEIEIKAVLQAAFGECAKIADKMGSAEVGDAIRRAAFEITVEQGPITTEGWHTYQNVKWGFKTTLPSPKPSGGR